MEFFPDHPQQTSYSNVNTGDSFVKPRFVYLEWLPPGAATASQPHMKSYDF